MRITYGGFKLEVPEGVYRPEEDTYLLADHLNVEEGERVLELGTGCGLLSILAAGKGAEVIATDVSKTALDCARENARRSDVPERIDFRRGDLFEGIESHDFDLIIFNPPYLPVNPEESLDDEVALAWDGGADGRRILDRFLEQLEGYLRPGGRYYFVQSSLTGLEKTLKRIGGRRNEIEKEHVKVSFERLYLFRVRTPEP